MINFINLTNHTVNEMVSGRTIPPSGRRATVKTSKTTLRTVDGAPIYRTRVSTVDGLPDPREGTMYIVSSLVHNRVPRERQDVVSPGNTQRNENGDIVGCLGFKQL